MAVALVALVVALSGTAYAGLTIGSADVRNNSLTGRDIRQNSITSGDIRNNTLRLRDFRTADRESLVGPRGATGPQGPQGPQGPAGTVDTSQFFTKTESDARYLRGTITIVEREGGIAGGGFETLVANCPAGYQAIGGGVDPDNVLLDRVTNSQPIVNGFTRLTNAGLATGQHGPATGWHGAVQNAGAGGQIAVAVVCSPIG